VHVASLRAAVLTGERLEITEPGKPEDTIDNDQQRLWADYSCTTPARTAAESDVRRRLRRGRRRRLQSVPQHPGLPPR
jgi:hypothetical protein